MSAPALQRFVQGQGTVSADNFNTFESTADLASDLRAFIGTDGMQVFLRGIAAVDDGGQGIFYWNASGTGPDDNQTNIVPFGVTLGCWTRLSVILTNGVVMTSGATLTITETDTTVVVNKTTGSATTILLPADPFTWEYHEIVDGKGDASSNNIIIDGNGNDINGSSTLTINSNRAAKTLRFNGTEWNVISAT